MELFCRFGGMDGTRTRDLLRDRYKIVIDNLFINSNL